MRDIRAQRQGCFAFNLHQQLIKQPSPIHEFTRYRSHKMTLPFKPAFPLLLYAYPWMPYPRRPIIYLREKKIPQSLVKVVRVSVDQSGTQVVDASFPPRPAGSLPILAIPHADDKDKWTHIRQSMAIINFLEELCETKQYGFSSPTGPLMPTNTLARARETEILTLAEELLTGWNPVRMFGTGAGTISFPEGAKEMLRWERRALLNVEKYLSERTQPLRKEQPASIADIILYQFLEFTKDCYGVDMTIGSGEIVKDPYGKEIKEEFLTLRAFFLAFAERESAKRDPEAGETPGPGPAKAMGTWAEGVL